jgi:hypothetical protein
MINYEHEAQPDDAALEPILQSGAHGAVMLAGIATAVVIGLWFAFYLFVSSLGRRHDRTFRT